MTIIMIIIVDLQRWRWADFTPLVSCGALGLCGFNWLKTVKYEPTLTSHIG